METKWLKFNPLRRIMAKIKVQRNRKSSALSLLLGAGLLMSLLSFTRQSTLQAAPAEKAPQTKREASSIKSDSLSSNVQKIQNLIDVKKYLEALAEIEVALKSDKLNAELLTQKGLVLRELGKTEQAIQSLVDGLKVNPQLHKAKAYLAVTYLRIGEVKPVLQLVKELSKDAPDLAQLVKLEAAKLNIKL